MKPSEARLRGPLPAINDLAAVGILAVAYLVRIGSLSPEYSAPWWLSVTTDFILPSMAGAWLFVVATMVAIEYLDAV